MSAYDNVIELCRGYGVPQTVLEKELGFSRGSIGKMRTSNMTHERLQKIADYFHVSVEYLMTGTETAQKGLSDDERKILALYRKFNARGKSEAIRRLTELSRLTEYTDRGKRSSSSRIG